MKRAFCEARSGLVMRSRLKRTASALKGVPSWKVTPCLR